MSGSYDRRSGPVPPAPFGYPAPDAYEDPATGYPAGAHESEAPRRPAHRADHGQQPAQDPRLHDPRTRDPRSPSPHPQAPPHTASPQRRHDNRWDEAPGVGESYPQDEPTQEAQSRRGRTRPPAREPALTLDAPERDERRSGATARRSGGQTFANAPIVPAATVTGRSLTLVIAIMCAFACLTAGTVWMIKTSSEAWLRDIASEVTVQVVPRDRTDNDQVLAEIVAFLQRQPGIEAATALSIERSTSLLEPWLGTSDVLKSLPVPRLVAVRVDRSRPPAFDLLRASLAQRFPGATLDDHRQWQQQIRTVTQSFYLGGVGILVLVALATMAIIVSATRSAMASNRDIVEVLHFVGATDRFIAREFDKHFLQLGIRAGLFGATLAAIVFLSLPFVMQALGGGTMTVAELQRLIGVGGLDITGFAILGAVVVAIAGICMLTSRLGVFRILNAQQ